MNLSICGGGTKKTGLFLLVIFKHSRAFLKVRIQNWNFFFFFFFWGGGGLRVANLQFFWGLCLILLISFVGGGGRLSTRCLIQVYVARKFESTTPLGRK